MSNNDSIRSVAFIPGTSGGSYQMKLTDRLVIASISAGVDYTLKLPPVGEASGLIYFIQKRGDGTLSIEDYGDDVFSVDSVTSGIAMLSSGISWFAISGVGGTIVNMGGASDTAAQILAKLLTVDGPGSELDADLLDGMTPDEIAALSSGITDVERHYLNSIPGLEAKTSDLEVEVLDRTWGNVTSLSQGGFVSENSGNLGPVHAEALAYVVSKTATASDSSNNYVYIRIPFTRSSRDYRIRQDGSLGEFFITSWDHVGSRGIFDYYRSRHNLFESYIVTIQYDAATAIQTHYRGRTDAKDVSVAAGGFDGNLLPTDDTVQKAIQKVDDLDVPDEPPHLTPAEANDDSSDAFGEISGELVAGAIDAHHTTQHTWLTELHLDFRNPQAGTEPQFHVLIVSIPTTHDRILEFSNLTDDDANFIRSIIQNTIINIEGSFFTVYSYVTSGTDLWLQGEFNADPVLVDGETYRLRFTASRPADASDIAVDTSNFGGKLSTNDNTVQKVAERVDDFVFSAGLGGNPEWTDVQNRPNRPNAAELVAGNSTEEATPAVADIVSLVNIHRLARSNADPENIGNAAEEGTEAQVSRRDHVHRFPHDSTLAYDGDNSQFGVSVHDVIEHLQESVEYYTSSPYDYSQGGGASEGEIYTTSDFHKRITRIRFRFLPVPGTRYEARILRVHDDSRIHTLLGTSQYRTLTSGGSHHFDFVGSDGEAGILVPASTRIAIILSRLGGGIVAANTGTESSNSPTESYDDASQDFARQNSVVYDSENPPVDQHTHSHSDDIRGNIQISYTLTYNHGRFVGDNFDLSDDTPQENTTEGSAGSSEEAARSDHSHPGTTGGGPSSLNGNAVETLWDNRAVTEVALSVLAGSVDWARTLDIGFTRALVEADDDKDLRLRFQMTQGGQIRHFYEWISAETFRLMPEYTASSGNVLPTTGHLVFAGADGRTSRTASSLFSRLNIGVRQRTAAGEDALRILLSSSGNSHVAATNIRGIIELVPRVENLSVTGSGEGQQQQSASSTLASRTIVSGGTLLAANAFNFDVTSDGAFVAAGLGFEDVPISNIFDFVATIRIGGRVGNPIRLSKEQFDYVGKTEETIFGTWPFGGTGGGSWGDVSEIPCALMYINHVSEGVVKNSLKPQRRQIEWTITGTDLTTAILIFFDYDSAEENLAAVRMVAFTDQVVEIESMHVHYWEI